MSISSSPVVVAAEIHTPVAVAAVVCCRAALASRHLPTRLLSEAVVSGLLPITPKAETV